MAQIFPKWTNKLPQMAIWAVLLGLSFVVFVFWYWFSPKSTDVGYQPEQPIEYSHKIHAGNMGIDCRYCHIGVENASAAGVPPTQTCMNCHATVKPDSPKLVKVNESWKTDKPIHWIRIHKTPDYVYFDHSAHIHKGIGCKSCHGRVDQMTRVQQAEPLSMSWCLDCHRDPAKHLRPLDKITDMNFVPSEEWLRTAKLKAAVLNPPVESCSGCHR